jgi:hypothetical protein
MWHGGITSRVVDSVTDGEDVFGCDQATAVSRSFVMVCTRPLALLGRGSLEFRLMRWKKLSQARLLSRLRRHEVGLDGILDEKSRNSIDSRLASEYCAHHAHVFTGGTPHELHIDAFIQR